MSKLRLVPALAPAAALGCMILPGPAAAQTANGSPTAPAPPGLVGTPRPVSRTPPSVGERRAGPGAALPTAGTYKPPRPPTAAERAEQRKLERDLNICIGC